MFPAIESHVTDVPREWLAIIKRYDGMPGAWVRLSLRRRSWPTLLRDRMCESQNHRCAYCGVRMDSDNPQTRPTFEHVQPLGRGGIDWITNIVIACHGCNQAAAREMHRKRREAKKRKRERRKRKKAAPGGAA